MKYKVTIWKSNGKKVVCEQESITAAVKQVNKFNDNIESFEIVEIIENQNKGEEKENGK